jgi:cbb3-type cytochrome oxidase subunit 3
MTPGWAVAVVGIMLVSYGVIYALLVAHARGRPDEDEREDEQRGLA